MKKSGFAIILVLATLVLLAMLSLTYIKLALIDRNIARNYMDNKRAKLIAQSGVDYAIARLNAVIKQPWFENGKLTNIDWATDPSYPYPGEIKIHSVNTKFTMPFSGSTYGQNSDILTLKIIDTQSQININDGANISNTHYTSVNLQRILNLLGQQLTTPIAGLGDTILDRRPANGYTNKQELIKYLSQENYNRIKDFITTHSWTNDSVCIPVPLSNYQTVMDSYPFFNSIARPADAGEKIYRYGQNKNWKGDVITSKLMFGDPSSTSKDHGVYSTDALNPQWIELTQRSPVNINLTGPEILKALIIDLEGFFVMERRTPNPPFASGADTVYSTLKPKYTYDKQASGSEAWGAMTDELGFIYKTVPYYGTGGRNASGIDANKIVQEIIACQKREISPNIAGLDYSLANFGGPFKSWAQFNIFVDKIVEKGLISDNRDYFDLKPSGSAFLSWVSGSGYVYANPPPVTQVNPSDVQRRLASIAAGDVLKANFNPNLHLNELNPERQLFTMVDKTELIVNSTEFCFTPMGYFEIESEGYVLLPQGTKDSLTASDNQIVARAKIDAVAKLYDVYYETSQNKFYQGEFSDRVSTINNNATTNNNCAVETGPEVDNGTAIAETEHDGYIRLSTNLGSFSGVTKKPKKELWTTYYNNAADSKYPGATAISSEGSSEYNESIHSHFQLDHVTHYHSSAAATAGLPMGSIRIDPDPLVTNAYPERYNFPDKSETRRSPYSPVDDSSRYRLCRSFRSSENNPSGYLYAPSDLRSDGVYIEPHSAFGYDSVSFTTEAVVSFWIKPNWFPELGGRMRTFTSMRKYMPLTNASNSEEIEWPLPFNIDFWPREPAYAFLDPDSFPCDPTNRLFIIAYYSNSSSSKTSLKPYPHTSRVTETLNHEFEYPTEDWDRFKGSEDGQFNFLRNREWMHVIVRFYIDTTAKRGEAVLYIDNKYSTFFFFGIPISNPPNKDFSDFLGPYILIGGDSSSYCATNAISVAHSSGAVQSYLNRIFYADSTMDEFFFWPSNGVTSAQNIWKLGRYYKPQDTNSSWDSVSGEAIFTSQQLNIINKPLPGESTITPPAIDGSGILGLQANNIEILGIAWTYYAEDYLSSTEADGTPRLKPAMWNHKDLTSSPFDSPNTRNLNTTDARSLCEVRLNINNVDSATYYDDDGYSAVDIGINPSDTVKYKVKFKIGSGADLNSVLLASPIFDDITIYYTSPVRFLSFTYFQ